MSLTRNLKLRLKKSQKHVGGISAQAEQQIEDHLFNRFESLVSVRKFVFSWVGLIVLLIILVLAENLSMASYYEKPKTLPGGIYNEGVLGRFTNANPIYATNNVDTDVSKLLFAGLFQVNSHGQITSDLAQSYSVDSVGTTYTVKLKPNLTWQDGKPLTSADVVFTYDTIKNPDAQSPLESSWQGISVTAPNSQTVVFKLPDVLASFPYSMTNGIIPEHILDNVPAADLRSADFNDIDPVGAGPFSWQGIEISGNSDSATSEQQVVLTPFSKYQGGKPKLDKFVFDIFADQNQLLKAFKSSQLTATASFTTVPESISKKNSVIQNNFILRAANMVFFKVDNGVLANKSVRQALVMAANVPQIINGLGYATPEVREPLLQGQLGYNIADAQAGYNFAAAQSLLKSDGWVPSAGSSVLSKGGQSLSFGLTVYNDPEDVKVANQLKRDWQKLGVDVKLQLLGANDFQNAVEQHNYDSIIDAISIGVDPDVFAYWDSSQADIRSANRLNLSEYKNSLVDESLESGRTRLDPQLRVIKYQGLLQNWAKDDPALGLYQPEVLYLTNGYVGGVEPQLLNSSTDLYDNVQNWEIRQTEAITK